MSTSVPAATSPAAAVSTANASTQKAVANASTQTSPSSEKDSSHDIIGSIKPVTARELAIEQQTSAKVSKRFRLIIAGSLTAVFAYLLYIIYVTESSKSIVEANSSGSQDMANTASSLRYTTIITSGVAVVLFFIIIGLCLL